MVKRHAGWHTAIPIVAGYILDGGNKAIAAVHLKAILAGVQRLPYCLPVLIGDLHGRNQQLSFRLGGEIKEILSVCGLRGRQGFRCGVFYFCVFRERGVHGSRLFDRLRVRCQHTERQAGQEHCQQEQCGGHSFQVHQDSSHQYRQSSHFSRSFFGQFVWVFRFSSVASWNARISASCSGAIARLENSACALYMVISCSFAA